MTFLYNAKKRKPRQWVLAAFLLIPVLLIAIVFLVTQKAVRQHKATVENQQADKLFNRL